MKKFTKPSQQAPAHDHRHAAPTRSGAAAGTIGTRYTCTMHPEIVRDAPGSCPKCGMTLVPV